jgi:hypothetical protein
MSFSYQDTGDSEHLRLLTPAIAAFISRSQNPLATASTCPRQTVFFFAGGLATQLLRATEKFRDGVTKPQTFDYEVAWVTEETLNCGTVRNLKMDRDGSGVFRDKGDRIIVASGVIYAPLYDGFIAWCANNNLAPRDHAPDRHGHHEAARTAWAFRARRRRRRYQTAGTETRPAQEAGSEAQRPQAGRQATTAATARRVTNAPSRSRETGPELED